MIQLSGNMLEENALVLNFSSTVGFIVVFRSVFSSLVSIGCIGYMNVVLVLSMNLSFEYW